MSTFCTMGRPVWRYNMSEIVNYLEFVRLNSENLTSLVRQALQNQAVRLVDWDIQANNVGRGSATAGVDRFSGAARDGDELLPWTLILKVLSPSAHGHVPAELSDSGHPLYWKREALVYQSGLLDGLPEGLTAPRCLGAFQQDDGSIWLWLEEATDADGPRWPLAQFGRAAQAIGRLNGRYLVQ